MPGKPGKFRALAQVRASLGDDCKIADDSLPRFESWTCHPFAQVSAVRRPSPADAESGFAGPAEPVLIHHPACRRQQDTGDQPGCNDTPPGPPLPEGRKPRRSGSCAKYVPKNSPLLRLPRARHASSDSPRVPGQRSPSHAYLPLTVIMSRRFGRAAED